jgi:preprotein translocase subunit SecA
MLDFITKAISKVFGTKYDRDIKAIMPLVAKTNEAFKQLSSLSNDALRNKTLEFRQRIQQHLAGVQQDLEILKQRAADEMDLHRKELLFEEYDKLSKERDKHLEDVLMQLLPEAFAVVKETARRFKEYGELEVTATDFDRRLAPVRPHIRIEGDKAYWPNQWDAAGTLVTWDMMHYDVQLIGGIVLHQGKISEMATGEGKTLVSTLPSYLNGLSGLGVHIVTVNDYLARRDSEWMGPLLEFLFLTIDCIDKHRPNSPERRNAYLCDIVYGTNNEFGFDYLRDNMVQNPSELVQGKHHYAMVDEVDSVLIDDARTPLIISGPVPKGEQQQYEQLKPRVERLLEEQKKLTGQFLAEAKRLIGEGSTGYQEGEGGLALFRAFRGLPKSRPLIKYLSEPGIKTILQKTENYYMQEQSKNMKIADKPLFFTIEEKNSNVELTEYGSEYLAKGTNDPNFFVLTDVGSEISVIEKDSTLGEEQKAEMRDKIIQDYAAKAERLHCIQQLLKAYTLFHINEEYVVMEGKVKIVDEKTGRIMEGRRYSDGLHQALEAKENVHIEDATQTYATVTLQNYFRMYHKLAGMTGTAETEAQEFWEIYKLDVVAIPTNKTIARKDKEDLVYKTASEKYNAAVDEIVRLTEAGRPVLVGTTSVEISELLSRYLTMRKVNHNVLNAKHHQKEAQIVAEAGQAGQVTIATNMAGRGTDIKLGPGVKEAGGLAIIGTERHESRRVDRQLRGRAGRQGDPGSSQFFVSLEDNLMRLFGSDRTAAFMDRAGHQKGDVLQHSLLTKFIERAQKKVEENHFGMRKRLLEYDNVMNIQREAIYKKRHHALWGERLGVDLNNMFYDLAEEVLTSHKQMGDYEAFSVDTYRYFGAVPNITEQQFREQKTNTLVEAYQDHVWAHYQQHSAHIVSMVMPVVQSVLQHEGHKYKNIAIPYTDGYQVMNLVLNMEEAVKSGGKSLTQTIEKAVALSLIDNAWKAHLLAMDDLKESTSGASFEQKDPLVIYKLEAYNLFRKLVSTINRDVTSFLSRGGIPVQEEQQVQEAQPVKTDMSQLTDNNYMFDEEETPPQKSQNTTQTAEQAPRPKSQPFVRMEKKIGRNDLCPCGSGKKFKNCHGQE